MFQGHLKKDYSLSDEYEDFLGGIKIIHTTEFLFDLFKKGKMNFTKQLPWKVTYHDPCHTGRHLIEFDVDKDGSRLWKDAYVGKNEGNCLYEIPREILNSIPGIEFTEMKRIKSNSYCCGGGGGVMTGYGDWAAKNAGLRVQEALETGAEQMISICPFCHYNLNEGAKRIKSDMRVYDLVELIDMVL